MMTILRSVLSLVFVGTVFLESRAQEAPVQDSTFPQATPESQGISSEALLRLAAAAQRFVEKDMAVGVELAVIKNRRLILHDAYGWWDREEKIALEPNAIYNIRSMTKPITGAALQILIDEGEVSLEDRVSEYLPGFDNDKSEDITIEQILTHRSGLPLTIITEALDQYPDLESQANAVGERGPEFPPGSKFWYSDAASDVVAAVVELASGETLEDFVTERLLEPLGMNDTFYLTDPGDPRCERIAALYFGSVGAWSKLWKFDGKPFYPFPWGSQSLYGTALDYARFIAMWMDSGMSSGGDEVLTADAVERILTPASRMSMLGSDQPFPTFFPGLTPAYGQMSVLHVPEDEGLDGRPVIVGHSGSDGTIVWGWPERDLIVLCFTQSRGGTAVLRLERSIQRHLFNSDAGADEIPEEFKPLVGTYLANFGSHHNEEFEIVYDGCLALDIPTQLVFDLIGPDANGQWLLKGAGGAKLSFERNEQEQVVALLMHAGGGSPLRVPRGQAPVEAPLDPKVLQKYVGTYSFEGEGVTKLVIQDGRLAMVEPTTPFPVPMKPRGDGRWFFPANPRATLSFDENAEGHVTSYTIHVSGQKILRTRIEEEGGGG